ncbi:MAG: hypothetical protein IJ681_04250 [Bacteroidales bacterium]|nr:hypothetical protein [Bacteroidales bacterium]
MKIKRLLALGVLLLISFATLKAQTPPSPEQNPNNQAKQSLNRTPVGTATALLLGLGAGVLGYRLRKNTKESNE